MSEAKKRRLGKGLEDLMKTYEYTENSGSYSDKISIDKIFPNPEQPRKNFNEEALGELAESIKNRGVIQPILVEKQSEDKYIIIAGERRFRAAKMAGLDSVPCILCNYSDREKLEIALIENIHRKDLNPIEEANAYNQLMKDRDITQEELAKTIGKKRTTIANSIRLLKLPENMRKALEDESLTSGHARALLSVNDPVKREELFHAILKNNLSVRECELKAMLLNSSDNDKKEKSKKSFQIVDIEQQLSKRLETKVYLNGLLNKGKIEISYYSADDLQRILNYFG